MIFQILEDLKVNIPTVEVKWVTLGVEFAAAKKKGMTASKFAEEKNIKYSTFTSAMSKYSKQIQIAIHANTLKSKHPSKLTRKEKASLMINSYRSSLRTAIKNNGAAVNNKSVRWFTDTIKSIRTHKVTKPIPGKLYAFVYDAKHKDTLPFWDKYPLIIYLGLGKQGNTRLMYGLNLHYIPPKARQQLLEDLLVQYSSTTSITNNTKLKIQWDQVKDFRGVDKMIKAYLPNHVQGTFIEIKPSDWANVTMLPLQQFVSKGNRYSARKVWSGR